MKRNIELVKAARLGDLEKVKNILETTETFEYDEPYAALKVALYTNNKDIIKELIVSGKIDINAKLKEDEGLLKKYKGNYNDNFRLSLINAMLDYYSSIGDVDMIEFLIDLGADVNLENGEKRIPLSYALENGHFDAVKCLIKNGTDIRNSHLLWYPARAGHLELVKYLVELGSFIKNSYALGHAAERGHFDVVKYLIEKGADPKEDSYSLIAASSNGNLEMLKYLLDNGARVDEEYLFGKTALMYASENGHLEIVKYLIEKGANIETKDRDGLTALIYASKNGHYEIVKCCIENGSDVNAYYYGKDSKKYTALSHALEKGYREIAEILKINEAIE